ncbi:hypothetical protein GZH47_13840 [Paenibacillus rhizovicinus]|uniref:Uncharacterized protein n=1 Tax=Paenibacillus rhizovicinus TaxID=2704463 RepID=A0A6C0P592_9BACL|nr:hypothetical protein [Paenibacillus rhizovicinus]QHW31812.1 hypothetical protein GZH47_13840 [Paenibacillus rhizovicinus]
MSSTDPVWYEALQEEPVQGAAFRPALKASVLARAVPASARARTSSRFRGVMIGGAALIGVLALIGFARLPLGQAHDHTPDHEHAASPTQSTIFQDDTDWRSIIDAKYPGWQNEIIFEQNVGDDHKVIFTRRVMEYKGQSSLSLAADAFIRDRRQWTFSSGYTYTNDDLDRAKAKNAVTAVSLKFDSYSYYFGMSFNPQASRIRIVNPQSRVIAETKTIKHDSDGNAYWIILVNNPDFLGFGLKVEGLDASGSVLASNYSH